ncbi:Docosahexaenoic acid omega-hydroxylase CYP4F3 [Grifola frondosa]|uniref:Docosahexaenoic acid omega-hydroxylase CYP4F3 n=1 Tax=Grifola frondosa TaxID=5627 RepID=A0A1C7LTX4_GRIFR|nr:Docosahexaenoic acid omega-hydroxylase CYP4F3 [Grifola frondosa]
MAEITVLLQSALICAATWFLWRYFRHIFVKSPLDNLPGPPSQSFVKGNLSQLYDPHGWAFHRELAETYGPVVKLHGMFGRKILHVFDPKALHAIIVKDQYVFEEATWFLKTNMLAFGPGLLSTLGDHHRKQRKLLNPVFSINHMRHMLPIFYEITHKLRDAVASRLQDGPGEVDMLGWMARTALELIGQGGLGYSFDPLVEDKADAYGEAVKQYMPTLYSLSLVRWFLPYLTCWGSPAFRRSIVEAISQPKVQKLKLIINTMYQRSIDIFEAKKAALQKGDEAILQQVGEGKDIMSILLKANMAASADDKLPESELIAQMSTLTFAAMDTTSNALAQTLHLLAQHPDVQEKLRKEILEAQENGEDIPYDELTRLPYLDAVCRESLRLHAPAPMLFRETRKDTILPLSEPICGVDGSMISEILVPKDTTVHIGIMSSNCNRALWGDDAYKWKPERWLAPLPHAVEDAHIPGVYSNLMTFLGGGRACIGFKFSQLEMKVVLSLLIASFTFELSDKPIVWNLAGVRYPTVGKDSKKPQMPLKVTPLKEDN